MGKHSKQQTPVLARGAATAATASLAVSGVGILSTQTANAAMVQIPGTTLTFDAPGIENIPNIETIPGIEQWVPQLADQASDVDTQGIVQAAEGYNNETVGQRIVDIARSKIGSPYAYGASGPSAFDCSGFTSWVYREAGITIPRTSQAQAYSGTPVSLNDLQPGDIISYYSGASHVGIYTGNGTIIDALNSGIPVTERDLYYMPIHSAVRF